MSRLTPFDEDLHAEDGTHRATARSANGAALVNFETRITLHMAEHLRRDLDDIDRVLTEYGQPGVGA